MNKVAEKVSVERTLSGSLIALFTFTSYELKQMHTFSARATWHSNFNLGNQAELRKIYKSHHEYKDY